MPGCMAMELHALLPPGCASSVNCLCRCTRHDLIKPQQVYLKRSSLTSSCSQKEPTMHPVSTSFSKNVTRNTMGFHTSSGTTFSGYKERNPSVTCSGQELKVDFRRSSELEILELIRRGVLGEHPDEAALKRVANLDIVELTAAAAQIRDKRADGNVITFSPKVFIPLTRVCRDFCGYCTFAMGPKAGQPVYMSIGEVLEVARAGVAAGCTEALFTLGDKPELLYAQAKQELEALGYTTTVSYAAKVAEVVMHETGLLPHINAGVMSRDEVVQLRRVSVSQGLMVESGSEKLLKPGGAHHRCPDKVPSLRLATIAAAGQEKVPFTSGLLIGIGESREDRLKDLVLLRDLHQQYGHIQELIIQNFRAKKGTAMENAPEPPITELQWTIAMARFAFGPTMNIQAPPNLTPILANQTEGSEWAALINAGINDWGGLSPVTKDWVNPEAPWPHVELLTAATAKAGKLLVPRLAVYPSFIDDPSTWLDPEVLKKVLANSNSLGYARAEGWSPGLAQEANFTFSNHMHMGTSTPKAESESFLGSYSVQKKEQTKISVGTDGTMNRWPPITGLETPEVTGILHRISAAEEPTEAEVTMLFHAMGPEFLEIVKAADSLRAKVNGDEVTYVINRNINYTNVCGYRCQFCAFSKGKLSEDLRGKPYRLSLEEITRRAVEAWERGATEVCMQKTVWKKNTISTESQMHFMKTVMYKVVEGGIHPEFTGETYLEILRAVKKVLPDIHVHAFSPLEVFQGANTLGISVKEFLLALKKAGLGSLPGTAAEVLDDEVRQVLCPDKITTNEWLEIMETAHGVGLKTTSTIMFGHLDHPYNWARHLLSLRNLARRTGGFSEFVPLPFVHMEEPGREIYQVLPSKAPVYLKGRARKGPTSRECVLMHSVARLVLHPFITNIQASWVKMGPGGAQALLAAGCNDMGGSLMNESITRAAGALHGEELPPEQMERLIMSTGKIPHQRTTLYGDAPSNQRVRAFSAGPLMPTQ